MMESIAQQLGNLLASSANNQLVLFSNFSQCKNIG
jgi:hypothetical protein